MPSLYEISIPVFISNLKILAGLLEKGVTHAAGNEATLTEARLIADMAPLPFQIQTCSNTAKFFAVRVGKVEAPTWEDNEKTIPELQERIAKTIAFLESVDPKAFEDRSDAEIILPTRTLGDVKFSGDSYTLKFAIPNFYFHFVTAYALLRKEGVPVGKNDFLGRT